VEDIKVAVKEFLEVEGWGKLDRIEIMGE